jgi:hypothetical protein
MIYYDFSKFQPKISKRSSAILFIWVRVCADRSLELFLLLYGVPGRDFWNRESSGSSIPMMGCFPEARDRWGSIRDTRATFGWARLTPGWLEELANGGSGAPASSGERGRWGTGGGASRAWGQAILGVSSRGERPEGRARRGVVEQQQWRATVVSGSATVS